MPTNSFSVKSLLSEKQKKEEPGNLIKPIPMLGTPTTSSAQSINSGLPYYCSAFFPQANPHSIAIASAMAALNGGMVDPTTLLMLQSLATTRTQTMSSKQAESSPTEMNTSTSSSPQCIMPSAGFSNWLTPSTELSSSSSLGIMNLCDIILSVYYFQMNPKFRRLL
jgi:hypothetical protein